MKGLLWSLFFVVAATQSALATPELNIVSGGSNVTFNGSGDQVLYANDVNGWNVSLVLGLSNSPDLSGTPGGFGVQLTSVEATCFGGGCSTDPLDIFLSDTGFTQPGAEFQHVFQFDPNRHWFIEPKRMGRYFEHFVWDGNGNWDGRHLYRTRCVRR